MTHIGQKDALGLIGRFRPFPGSGEGSRPLLYQVFQVLLVFTLFRVGILETLPREAHLPHETSQAGKKVQHCPDLLVIIDGNPAQSL